MPASGSLRWACLASLSLACGAVRPPGAAAAGAAPLVIGETFTMASAVLSEQRRINLYRPPAYGVPDEAPRPVLYVLDGGLGEDFLHVAGLAQVSTANGTMRPFLLVGVENTQRRRDLTGPTEVAADRAIAPVVGGSAAFRRFLREELMPRIARDHRVTGEAAVVGESLAGLFVVETFLLEPELFQTYLAFEPTLGWNDGWLLRQAGARLASWPALDRTLYLASADERANAAVTRQLAR